MIYTASYFQPENHHGKLISISRSEPKGFKVDGKLGLFCHRNLAIAFVERYRPDCYGGRDVPRFLYSKFL